MKQLLVLLFLVASLTGRAQSDAWTYARPSGVTATAIDTEGMVYLTGSFSGSLQLGDTPLTSPTPGICLFIAKCTPNGQVLQVTKIEGAESMQVNRIAVDAEGNSYVTGSFFGIITYNGDQQTKSMDYDVFAGSNSAFLLKCSASGLVSWVQQGSSGGSSASFCEGRGVAVDRDGNSYFAGLVNGVNIQFGTLTFGQRRFQGFVASYNLRGQLRWARVLAGIPPGFGTSPVGGVAVDNAGSCYITGVSIRGWTVDGLTLNALPTSGPNGTIFLAKFNAQQGNAVWAVSIPGQGDGRAIGVDKKGNVYIGGSFQDAATFAGRRLTSAGDADGFVASYNAQGVGRWATALGGPGYDVVNDLVVDQTSGKITATGAMSAQVGTSHTFLQQFGPSGHLQNLKLVGGPGTSVGNVLAIDSKDNLYLTGTFAGRCIFGSIELNATDTQGYLARYGSRQVSGNDNCTEVPLAIGTYPNPAQNSLTLSAANLKQELKATLYNQQGHVLTTQTLPVGKAPEATFDTTAFPNGTYVLRLEAGSLITTRLITVQH